MLLLCYRDCFSIALFFCASVVIWFWLLLLHQQEGWSLMIGWRERVRRKRNINQKFNISWNWTIAYPSVPFPYPNAAAWSMSFGFSLLFFCVLCAPTILGYLKIQISWICTVGRFFSSCAEMDDRDTSGRLPKKKEAHYTAEPENEKPINKLPVQRRRWSKSKRKNHVLSAMKMYFITSTILIWILIGFLSDNTMGKGSAARMWKSGEKTSSSENRKNEITSMALPFFRFNDINFGAANSTRTYNNWQRDGNFLTLFFNDSLQSKLSSLWAVEKIQCRKFAISSVRRSGASKCSKKFNRKFISPPQKFPLPTHPPPNCLSRALKVSRERTTLSQVAAWRKKSGEILFLF